MNFLSLFVLIPLLMMLGLWIARDMKQIRTVAVIGSTILLALSVYTLVEFLAERAAGNTATMLFTDSRMWYAPLNIHYAVGVDGVSVAMLLLSSIIVFAGVFASWKINPLPKEYFLWFMLLSTGVFGFFISVDLFTMFMFYEVALIPMYLLIGVWGSGRKNYSAMKLTLMLMGGSALLMIGILGIYYQSGLHSMNVVEIAEHGNIPMNWQYFLFPMTFVGFGVLGAMFPFHTWSPDGHASAPTAVSMLHAGVLMKLGGYGCFRVAIYLMPQAATELAWIFLILTGISVVYGAFSACVQTDLKYINAYSSVSHCGLVLFAILMLNTTAMTGAVMQMLSHGLMTALFFALIGMIYANHAVPFGLLRDCRFGFVGSPGIERLRCRNDYICRFVRAYRYVPPSVYHRSLYFDCDYSGLYFAGCRQTFVRRCSERTSPGVDRCRMVGTSVGHYLDRMRGRYRLFSELDFRFDSSRCGTYN